jgi:ZIP family zinc transporter
VVAAALWALVAASSLVIGALLSLTGWITGRRLALLIAFGSGTLVSAVAYDLVEEAVKVSATGVSVGLGFTAGAFAYFFGDEAVQRMPGGGEGGQQGGLAVLLGAVLDGIPESIVLGLSLVGGGAPSIAVLAAIFISNIPESVQASTQMRESGRSVGFVLRVWVLVALASAAAAAIGYAAFSNGSGDQIAFIDAFAAGAILVLLADELLPAAHAESDKVVGLATALGFAIAAFLSFND